MSALKVADLFAGAGGSSTGATMAGCELVYAANHWPLAVKSHAINHPGAEHYCQDLFTADWSALPDHDVLTASPCCQGHSKARGKADDNSEHDASRNTAFCVVDALTAKRPGAFVVENVTDFRRWSRFPEWKAAINALGYSMREYVIDAADLGVPQHRERLFIVGNLGREAMKLRLTPRQHVPVSAVIDWDSGSWSDVYKPGRAKATIERVEAGRKVYGSRFVAPFYGSGSGKTGRSIERPIGTLTTKDRWSLIDGDRLRMFTVSEQLQIMGFPGDYTLLGTQTEQKHQLGNAVCPPVMRDILSSIKRAA